MSILGKNTKKRAAEKNSALKISRKKTLLKKTLQNLLLVTAEKIIRLFLFRDDKKVKFIVECRHFKPRKNVPSL